MLEATGNIWTMPFDVICITTNGILNSYGELIMGKGIALEAKKRCPDLPKILGNHVKEKGNIPCVIGKIASFPTKNHWIEDSSLKLIVKSATWLQNNLPKGIRVLLPRVGCGNGSLEWEDVKKVISQILDDRFTVIGEK